MEKNCCKKNFPFLQLDLQKVTEYTFFLNFEHCITEKHTRRQVLIMGKTDSKENADLPHLIPVV